MTAAYFHRKTTTAAVTAAPMLMHQRIQSRRISTSIRSMVGDDGGGKQLGYFENRIMPTTPTAT